MLSALGGKCWCGADLAMLVCNFKLEPDRFIALRCPSCEYWTYYTAAGVARSSGMPVELTSGGMGRSEGGVMDYQLVTNEEYAELINRVGIILVLNQDYAPKYQNEMGMADGKRIVIKDMPEQTEPRELGGNHESS